MADNNDHDDESVLVDLINHAIVTHANPPCVSTGELPGSRRSGCAAKTADCFDKAILMRRGNAGKGLLGGFPDEDRVFHFWDLALIWRTASSKGVIVSRRRFASS